MADALISPAVGGTMWAVSAGLMAWCARGVRQLRDDRLIPMMGVMGAFVFTAQMINFAIPLTGSSGHLGGGLLLAILLGPHAAFLVIASVLTVQALFFADGGLLALGCNIFNLGFAPVFIAYPLFYRLIAGGARVGVRAWFAALVAGIVGLQLGAFGVVLESWNSGVSELPFRTFILLMQPIHLAIGIVEGLVTAVIVGFIARARPEALVLGIPGEQDRPLRPVLLGLLVMAAILGGSVSWFASVHPDGLEWAISKVTGKAEMAVAPDAAHTRMAAIQKKTALLPDYEFKGNDQSAPLTRKEGKSVSGLLGGGITMIVALMIGYGLRKRAVKTS